MGDRAFPLRGQDVGCRHVKKLSIEAVSVHVEREDLDAGCCHA